MTFEHALESGRTGESQRYQTGAETFEGHQRYHRQHDRYQNYSFQLEQQQ